jgi:hypothetical protein
MRERTPLVSSKVIAVGMEMDARENTRFCKSVTMSCYRAGCDALPAFEGREPISPWRLSLSSRWGWGRSGQKAWRAQLDQTRLDLLSRQQGRDERDQGEGDAAGGQSESRRGTRAPKAGHKSGMREKRGR